MPEERSTLSAKLSRFPRLGLAHLPTPLEPMRRLTEHLGGPRLWVKREDATGVGFGGNKLRKLDYVLHEAMAAKADTLVSGGVVQSNSQRQVAAAAAKLGLQCHLAVYHGRLSPPTPEYDASGNALLNRLFGAHLHDVPWTGDRNDAIEALAAPWRSKARAWSGSMSMPNRSACEPTSSDTRRPLPTFLTHHSMKGTWRSWPATPDRLTASRMTRPSRRSGWRVRSKLSCSIRSIPARGSPG